MQNIPEKIRRYFPSGRYHLAALVGMVVSTLSDPQSSQSDWDAGRAMGLDISTTSTQAIQPGTTGSVSVASSNGFTAANSSKPAYLIFTDGINIEIVKYGNSTPASFTSLTRGQYGTQARSWPSGTTIYQLTYSHGSSPDYDLEPQPRNWWVNLSVSGSAPSQRVGHGWVYRPADGCYYLFGGRDGNNSDLADLWRFNPTTRAWTHLTPGGSAPAARSYAAVVYAAAPDQIWVHGGISGSSLPGNTYKYSFASNSWSTSSAWNLTPARTYAMACYDKYNNQMIIAGGLRDYIPDPYLRETYVFNGSTWTKKTSIPDSAHGGYDGVAYGSGCWMTVEKRFFVVGYTSGGNYVALAFDPLTNSWETASIPNPPTSKRRFPACCYDEISRKALLFGGENSTTATAEADLWVFHYPTKSWTQLASFTFDSSADKYARHGMAWDSAKNQAVAWGGWSSATPTWHTYSAPIYFRHYHPETQFRTQTMDIGAEPLEDGVWNLEDVYDFLNGSNSIEYSAEYSDNETDWVSIGTVQDGGDITEERRYWRVTVKFSCKGDQAPRVQKIDAVFDKIVEFSMAERSVGEALPIVKSIGTLTSSIDPIKCTAQIGGITVELLDKNNVASSSLISAHLIGKTIFVKVGALENGVGIGDFFRAFTGIIENWEYDGSVIKISARDFLGKLEKDIPEEDANGGISPLIYNAAGIASHPVDILLDILRNQVNVPDRYLDMSSFDDVRADPTISGWAFNRAISDPTDAYDLCLDICRHIGAILIPRENGRISLKMLKNTQVPVETWNELWHNFGGANFNANMDLLRNYVSTWWHWDGSGDEWENFEGAEVAADAESVSNWGAQIIRTKSKWLGDNVSPYNGDQLAEAISTRILNMAREGMPVVTFDADISTIQAQVGDVVRIQSSAVSNYNVYRAWQIRYNPKHDLIFIVDRGRFCVPYLVPGCNECVDMLWWVTRKRIDLNRGSIKWELMRCRRMPLDKDYTSKEDFYQGSGENIDFETNPGAVQLALESPGIYYQSGYYDLVIDMGQQPERDGAWTLETTTPTGTSVSFTAHASETGEFGGEEMPLGTVIANDPITIKARFCKIHAILTASPSRAQTPAINRIKISFPV